MISQKPISIVFSRLLIAIIAVICALVLIVYLKERESSNRINCFPSKYVDVSYAVDMAQETISLESLEQLTLLASSNKSWSRGFSVADSTKLAAIPSPDGQMLVISGIVSYWDSRRSGSYWYSSIAIWEVNKEEEPLCYLIPRQGPRHVMARRISADNRYVLFDQQGLDNSLGDCKGITCRFVFDRVTNQELKYTTDLEHLFEKGQHQRRLLPVNADGRSKVCEFENATDELSRHFSNHLNNGECITAMTLSSDHRLLFVLIETSVESTKYGRIEIWGIVNKTTKGERK